MACGPMLSVNSAAPTATTRLVGQFWGLDSDRVFEFFLRQIVFPQEVNLSLESVDKAYQDAVQTGGI